MTIPELHENLVSYIGRYTTLKKVAVHEYAGPCPVCGGRDRLHVNEKKGWFCRKCTGEKFGDLGDFTALAFGWTLKETLKQFNLDRRATPAEIEAMETKRKAAQIEAMAEEAAKQEQVHQRLTDCGDWWHYYQNIEKYPEARAMWNKRGLSDTWIDYYRLGYNPGREFTSGDEKFISASLTIPYFRPVFKQHPEGGANVTWKVIGLQHRLLADNPPGGKYRPHFAGAGKHLFFADLHERQSAPVDVLIVEGEAKAMVTWSSLWDGDTCLYPISVIGIPGKGWREDWLDTFRKADRVTIILDPDATDSARKLEKAIGERARVILLPDKIDDLITMGVLDGFKLIEMLEAKNG
jgi:hypothetical protein